MAGLPDKLIAQVSFKTGGDIFRELLANKPKHLAKTLPSVIQDCELHQGEFGVTGSVIQWNYVLDGKEQRAKEVLEVDEEKKKLTFKVIEGNLLEVYKNVVISFHVETKGGVDYITWSIDYELLKPDNPHPLSLLDKFIEITKALETHIYGS